MQDGYGREIDYLRLSVTERCNYRCRYCMQEECVSWRDPGDLLTREELAEMAATAVKLGVRKIRLTGGEPLLRGDILSLCRTLRGLPGLSELCLTTNGALLPQLAEPLARSGADRVNISLDTLRRDRFARITRRDPPDHLLAGVLAAEAAGLSPIKLNTVLIGGVNEDEIEDFVNLTRHHPWEVRFIELMPMGPCAAWERSCFLPADTVLKRIPALREVGEDGVARRYRLPGALGTVGLISPVSHHFCAGCRRIRITADGRLKTCLHGAEEPSLRGLHGAALEASILRAIARKPLCHRLSEHRSDTPRSMHQIGG